MAKGVKQARRIHCGELIGVPQGSRTIRMIFLMRGVSV